MASVSLQSQSLSLPWASSSSTELRETGRQVKREKKEKEKGGKGGD
jgi:hypothetical protein